MSVTYPRPPGVARSKCGDLESPSGWRKTILLFYFFFFRFFFFFLFRKLSTRKAQKISIIIVIPITIIIIINFKILKKYGKFESHAKKARQEGFHMAISAK